MQCQDTASKVKERSLPLGPPIMKKKVQLLQVLWEIYSIPRDTALAQKLVVAQKTASFEWGPEEKKCSVANPNFSVSICAFWAIQFAGPCDVGGFSGGERGVREKRKIQFPQKKLKYYYPKKGKWMLDMKKQTDTQFIPVVIMAIFLKFSDSCLIYI